MKDDTSEIETGAQCYVLSNATTIYSYKGGSRKTYYQIGGKWITAAQSSYNTIPVGAYCVDYGKIQSLNSNAAFELLYLFIILLIAGGVIIGSISLCLGRILKYRF